HVDAADSTAARGRSRAERTGPAADVEDAAPRDDLYGIEQGIDTAARHLLQAARIGLGARLPRGALPLVERVECHPAGDVTPRRSAARARCTTRAARRPATS